MTCWRILKNKPLSKFQKCYFWIYLDSTLSKISNGTKITQNGVWMKKLWAKQNGGVAGCENWQPTKFS